jgi:hypothetical protein
MGEKKKKAVIFIFVLYDLSCLSQVSVTRLVCVAGVANVLLLCC